MFKFVAILCFAVFQVDAFVVNDTNSSAPGLFSNPDLSKLGFPGEDSPKPPFDFRGGGSEGVVLPNALRAGFLFAGAGNQTTLDAGLATMNLEVDGNNIPAEVFPISGEDNDCFFHALQAVGIRLTRDLAIEMLEQLEDPRLKTIVMDYIRSTTGNASMDVQQFLYNHFGAPTTGGGFPLLGFRVDGALSIVDVLAEILQIRIQIFDRSGLMIFETTTTENLPAESPVVRLLYGDSHLDLLLPRIRSYEGSSSTEAYNLGSQLGSGTFANVFKAIEHSTARAVALKCVKFPNLWSELIFSALPRHPHLLQLVSAFVTTDGLVRLGYELHLGPMDKCRNLDMKRSFRRMIGIFRAVYHLHALNVAHNDIKPENILVAKDGRYILGDFGNARFIFLHAPIWRPATTMCWASPEQCAGREYGRANDVWSLGCVLVWNALGRVPFLKNGYLDNASHAEQGEYTLSKLNETISEIEPLVEPEVYDLITRMLEVDPQKRITIEEVLSHPAVAKHQKITVLPINRPSAQSALQTRWAMLPGFLTRRLERITGTSFSFEISELTRDGFTLESWLSALNLFKVYYQPGSDDIRVKSSLCLLAYISKTILLNNAMRPEPNCGEVNIASMHALLRALRVYASIGVQLERLNAKFEEYILRRLPKRRALTA